MKTLFGRSFLLFLSLGAALVVWINVWTALLHQPIPEWWTDRGSSSGSGRSSATESTEQ
jgi:hypothetical protein